MLVALNPALLSPSRIPSQWAQILYLFVAEPGQFAFHAIALSAGALHWQEPCKAATLTRLRVYLPNPVLAFLHGPEAC